MKLSRLFFVSVLLLVLLIYFVNVNVIGRNKSDINRSTSHSNYEKSSNSNRRRSAGTSPDNSENVNNVNGNPHLYKVCVFVMSMNWSDCVKVKRMTVPFESVWYCILDKNEALTVVKHSANNDNDEQLHVLIVNQTINYLNTMEKVFIMFTQQNCEVFIKIDDDIFIKRYDFLNVPRKTIVGNIVGGNNIAVVKNQGTDFVKHIIGEGHLPFYTSGASYAIVTDCEYRVCVCVCVCGVSCVCVCVCVSCVCVS